MIFALFFAAGASFVSAEKRGISVKPKAPDILSSEASTDSTTEGPKVLRALIIGIDRFQDGKIRELRYCRKDADGLAALVSDRRYIPFDRVEVTTLFDRQATKEKVQACLEDLGRTSAPQDTAIVYFSSHGIQQDQRDAYWVLNDSRADLKAYHKNQLRVDPETADSISGKSVYPTGKPPLTEWVAIKGDDRRSVRVSPTESTNRQFLDFVRANPNWRKGRIPSQF